MKKRLPSIFLILVFLVGLSLLLYPSVSNYWNSFHQTRAISSYAESVAAMDEEKYQAMWQEAVEYNKRLPLRKNRFLESGAGADNYDDILNADGTGIMAYIEIEKIDVLLPIYHGTSDAVLQVAVGHIEGSSFPTGGSGTHTALSGHRGLPSAKLFSDLDELTEGDTFLIRTLDEVLTYEVDQILIVEPEDVSALEIVEGEDYCTLVTCTPYGINTHRILVRGRRIDTLESHDIRITQDATIIDPTLVAPVVAVPILLVLLILLLVTHRGSGRKKTEKRKRKERKRP